MKKFQEMLSISETETHFETQVRQLFDRTEDIFEKNGKRLGKTEERLRITEKKVQEQIKNIQKRLEIHNHHHYL